MSRTMPFAGVSVLIDVFVDGCISLHHSLSAAIVELGGSVAKKWCSSVTHLVFQDGRSQANFDRAYNSAGVKLVSPQWVLRSRDAGAKLDERDFEVRLAQRPQRVRKQSVEKTRPLADPSQQKFSSSQRIAEQQKQQKQRRRTSGGGGGDASHSPGFMSPVHNQGNSGGADVHKENTRKARANAKGKQRLPLKTTPVSAGGAQNTAARVDSDEELYYSSIKETKATPRSMPPRKARAPARQLSPSLDCSFLDDVSDCSAKQSAEPGEHDALPVSAPETASEADDDNDRYSPSGEDESIGSKATSKAVLERKRPPQNAARRKASPSILRRKPKASVSKIRAKGAAPKKRNSVGKPGQSSASTKPGTSKQNNRPLKKQCISLSSPKSQCKRLAVSHVDSFLLDTILQLQDVLDGFELCTNDDDLYFDYLVVGKPELRTMKVFMALARGVMIVKPEFVLESMQSMQWMDPANYEVQDLPSKECRVAHDNPDYQGLFGGERVFIDSGVEPDPAALSELLLALGATPVFTVAQATLRIVPDAENIQSTPAALSVKSLFDCVRYNRRGITEAKHHPGIESESPNY